MATRIKFEPPYVGCYELPDIDAFEAMMAREDIVNRPNIGSCDAPPFDTNGLQRSDAMTEISRFFKQTQRVIVPLTVQEILDEQIAHKLA